jgi:hypothetical protein
VTVIRASFRAASSIPLTPFIMWTGNEYPGARAPGERLPSGAGAGYPTTFWYG